MARAQKEKRAFLKRGKLWLNAFLNPFFSFSFREKGKRTAFSFCFSKKKTPGKRKETRENFRMVSPDPFYRPEPCSGLAAYGSRRIYDRLCRGRCRAQLFATKERYRCGLPLAGTHRRAFLKPFFSFSARKKRTVSIFQEKNEGYAKPKVHPMPPSRQKKPAPFRFRRGGENSISAAFFFLPKL